MRLIAVLVLLFAQSSSAQYAVPTDSRFGGGDGRTCTTAIILLVDTSPEAIRAENDWLAQRYPGGSKLGQELVSASDGKVWCDLIRWRKFDGVETKTYFDISRPRDKFIQSEKLRDAQRK